MNKFIIGVAIVFASLSTFAGEVTVKWQEPAKYTDIRAGDQDKDKFEATLFKAFDLIFANLAQRLPDNIRWQVTVTDLDLAGEIRPEFRNTRRELRVMKRIDRPAISFNSKLIDERNNVVHDEKVDLKDFNYLSGPHTVIEKYNQYPYEEYMIRRWFELQQSNGLFPRK